jgi:ABC-2 type transport system permease protein
MTAAVAGRYRFRHVARMEWIKLRSLRSTWWTLAIAIAAAAGIGVRIGASTTNSAGDLTFDTVPTALIGILLVSVLGVLAITSEYSSGMIRATLTATPRRLLALAAKATVFGVVALITGEAVSFLSFVSAAAALPHGMAAPALTDPGVLRALILTGASYCLLGVLGVGLGAIVRHTGAAVAIVIVGVYLVAPLAGRTGHMNEYMPLQIVQDSLSVTGSLCGAGRCPGILSPWAGLAMLALYAAVALAVGGWLLVRRDA